MNKIILALTIVFLAGCSTVTVRTDSQKESTLPPTYEKRFTYWWWGLKGEYSINIREVCSGKPVEQIQSVFSTIDTIGGIFTLGIYAPRTAKVWCEKGEA